MLSGCYVIAYLEVLCGCLHTQDGQTPSVPDFVAACAGLCTSSTKCLVSFETRSSELRQAFLSEASVWFNQVIKICISKIK